MHHRRYGRGGAGEGSHDGAQLAAYEHTDTCAHVRAYELTYVRMYVFANERVRPRQAPAVQLGVVRVATEPFMPSDDDMAKLKTACRRARLCGVMYVRATDAT